MSPSLKQVLPGELERELAATRRVLAAVPEDRLDWRPHEKSKNLGALANRVANLPSWMSATLRRDHFDVAGQARLEAAPSSEALLETWDRQVEELRDAARGLDDAALGELWTLQEGEQTLFEQTRGEVFRRYGISHLIHHRAQLAVFLRLVGVSVPSMYGPPVDEQTAA